MTFKEHLEFARTMTLLDWEVKASAGEGEINRQGPYFHPKGCTCGIKSLCDGSGEMAVYAVSFRAKESER